MLSSIKFVLVVIVIENNDAKYAVYGNVEI